MPDHIPDSVSLEELKKLLSQSQQPEHRIQFPGMNMVAFGDTAKHTGLMDLRLLIAYFVSGDGSHGSPPSPAQLVYAIAGLIEALLHEMELKTLTFRSTSDDIAERMIATRHLSRDDAHELRKQLHQAAEQEAGKLQKRLDSLRNVLDLFTILEREVLEVQFAMEHMSRAGMPPLDSEPIKSPESISHRLISDAFLDSVGCTRTEFMRFIQDVNND